MEEVDAAGEGTVDDMEGEDGALCEILRWRNATGEGGRVMSAGGCAMRPRLDKKMRTAVRSCADDAMDADKGKSERVRGASF